MMLGNLGVTIGGYAAALALLWLFIGAKSDIKAEIERCNTEKAQAVAEAHSLVRDAQIAAMERHMDDLEAMVAEADEARLVAEAARDEALKRPERVRTVIREVASADACIDTAVPAAVIDSLRD